MQTQPIPQLNTLLPAHAGLRQLGRAARGLAQHLLRPVLSTGSRNGQHFGGRGGSQLRHLDSGQLEHYFQVRADPQHHVPQPSHCAWLCLLHRPGHLSG